MVTFVSEINILLVDDEETILEVSKIYLERLNENYHITAVNSARKALKSIEGNSFDVIISDYQMPTMDGLELLSSLREQDNNIPFIIFTGRGREEVAIQALNLGADFYLQKGGETLSQFHELENLIEKLYEKKQADYARQHLLDQQISINQLALILGDTRDLNRIYKTIFQHIYAIMDADTFVVSFYDRETELISPGYALIAGKVLDIQIFPSRPLKHKESEIQSNVITSDRPIYLSDMRKGQTSRDDGDYTKSAVFVPMKIGGEIIGVMEVQSYRLNAYSEQDIQLLSALANVAAVAIQNARLFNSQQQMNIELLEEKERTQRYLDLVEVLILVLDLDGKIQMINQKGCDILGYSEEEIIGLNWFDNFIAEIDRLRLKQIFQDIIEHKKPISYGTNLVISKSGLEKQISWKTSILYDNQNNMIGLLNSGVDITEQEKTKDDLLESEQRYQRMAEFVSDGLTVVENGEIVYVNDRTCEILGYPRGELMKKSFIDIVDPEERDRVNRIFQKAEETKIYPNELDVWIFSKEGIKKYIKNTYTYSFEVGKIAHQFIITKDITEQKLADIAIKLSESNYRSTFDSIIDPMHVVDRNLTIILTNQAMINWLNSLNIDSNIKGKDVFEVFPFLSKEVEREYQQVFDSGKSLTTTGETILKDRSVITETRKIPILEEDKVVRVITIIRDISEEKIIEKQLFESELKHRLLFDNSSDGIITYNERLEILDANQRILKNLGYVKKELLNKKITDIMDKVSSENFKECNEIIKKDGFCQCNIIFESRDKRKIPSEISASLIEIGDEKVIQVIFRDISDRVKSEDDRTRFIENLRFLSQSAMEFLVPKDEKDIFEIIASKIHQLAGDCYVIITSYNESKDVFRSKAIKGIGKNIKRLTKVLGKDPYKLDVSINKKYIEMHTLGKLKELNAELHDLTDGTISKKASNMLISLLNLGKMYNSFFIRDNRMFGSVIIVMKKDHEIKNLELIEAFINQATTVLLHTAAEEELRRSEERFRNIINSSPLGIHIYELDESNELIFKGGNKAADTILGIKHSELIDKHILEVFPGSEKTEIPKIYKNIAIKGGHWDSSQVEYKDEKVIGKFDVHAFNAKPGCTVVMFQDVTNQLKAQDESQGHLENLAFLSESAMEFIGLTQFKEIYRYIGERVRSIVGDAIVCAISYDNSTNLFTIQALVGLENHSKLISKFIGRNLIGENFELSSELKKKLRTYKINKMETTIPEITKGRISEKIAEKIGDRLDIKEVYTAPFMTEDKLLGATIIFMQNDEDIMENSLLETFINQASVALLRRYAEVSLLASEERYRELVETMNDGLGVDDSNGIFIYVNPKLSEMLGYTSDEMIGKAVSSFLDDEYKDTYNKRNEKRPRKEQESYELYWTKKDGTKIPTIISPKSIFNKRKEYQGSFAVITDISERKQIEEQFKNQQLELQKQYNELESFSTTVAHDLRNSLQGIQLLNDMNEHENREAIAVKIKELSEFVNDLLFLAQKGKILGDVRNINLNKLLIQIVNDKKLLSPNTTFTVEQLPIIQGDELRLQQVFENLLMNIIKHAQATKVKIHSKEEKDYYQVIIEDNGIGIPENKLNEIIQSWSTMRYSSFGMLIVFKIVDAHKGQLLLESKEGKGTKVILHLPKRLTM
ncbi:MAG: PAS domain S-box protein [Asgard group archaeon]|nr:PAS domain S-box protein [Asgard group archaeon]